MPRERRFQAVATAGSSLVKRFLQCIAFSVAFLIASMGLVQCDAVLAAEESGTLQIVARYGTGNANRHTYMAMGEAVVFVEGQDAKLEADQIFYDDRSQIIEARGHVRVIRQGKLARESSESLKFRIDAPDYLLTEQIERVIGPKMILLAPEDIAR